MADPSGPTKADDPQSESDELLVAADADAVADQPVAAQPVPVVPEAAEFADDDAEQDGDESQQDATPRKAQSGTWALVAVVVVVALAAGAYVFGQSRARNAIDDAKQSTATTAFKAPADFTTFVDEMTGVKLSFPRSWEQRSTAGLPEKSLRLVAGIPNTGDSVSVRVTPYNSEITKENIADQKSVFDELIGGENVKVYENQVLTVRGLPALFYVYSFLDEGTGQTGIHAHFFVFQGRKMVSIVLQALPEARYAPLAPIFDTIVNSLEVAPGPPPDYGQSVAPVTTGPPTTTAAAPSTSAP